MRKLLGMPALVGALALATWLSAQVGAAEGDKVKVLIIDGQNNHDWRTTTPHMKKVLESSGRFVVDVATTPQKPALPAEPKDASEADLAKYKEALAKYADEYAVFRLKPQKFEPDLTKYNVVLSNYNGASWPAAVNKALEDNLKAGKIAGESHGRFDGEQRRAALCALWQLRGVQDHGGANGGQYGQPARRQPDSAASGGQCPRHAGQCQDGGRCLCSESADDANDSSLSPRAGDAPGVAS